MRAVLIACMLIAAGCQQYQAVGSGQSKVGAFSVTAPAAVWNAVPRAHAPGQLPTWTVDGVTLNSLSFVSGIEDGKPLVVADADARYPLFRADMLPTDIAELVQATCAKLFDATVSASGELKPLTIAGQPGFELSFEFVTSDEVIRRAFVGGTVKDAALQLVIFQAPRMHYYAKDLGHARDLIVSAQLP
jgi:hypothetical protein